MQKDQDRPLVSRNDLVGRHRLQLEGALQIDAVESRWMDAELLFLEDDAELAGRLVDNSLPDISAEKVEDADGQPDQAPALPPLSPSPRLRLKNLAVAGGVPYSRVRSSTRLQSTKPLSSSTRTTALPGTSISSLAPSRALPGYSR